MANVLPFERNTLRDHQKSSFKFPLFCYVMKMKVVSTSASPRNPSKDPAEQPLGQDSSASALSLGDKVSWDFSAKSKYPVAEFKGYHYSFERHKPGGQAIYRCQERDLHWETGRPCSSQVLINMQTMEGVLKKKHSHPDKGGKEDAEQMNVPRKGTRRTPARGSAKQAQTVQKTAVVPEKGNGRKRILDALDEEWRLLDKLPSVEEIKRIRDLEERRVRSLEPAALPMEEDATVSLSKKTRIAVNDAVVEPGASKTATCMAPAKKPTKKRASTSYATRSRLPAPNRAQKTIQRPLRIRPSTPAKPSRIPKAGKTPKRLPPSPVAQKQVQAAKSSPAKPPRKRSPPKRMPWSKAKLANLPTDPYEFRTDELLPVVRRNCETIDRNIPTRKTVKNLVLGTSKTKKTSARPKEPRPTKSVVRKQIRIKASAATSKKSPGTTAKARSPAKKKAAVPVPAAPLETIASNGSETGLTNRPSPARPELYRPVNLSGFAQAFLHTSGESERQSTPRTKNKTSNQAEQGTPHEAEMTVLTCVNCERRSRLVNRQTSTETRKLMSKGTNAKSDVKDVKVQCNLDRNARSVMKWLPAQDLLDAAFKKLERAIAGSVGVERKKMRDTLMDAILRSDGILESFPERPTTEVPYSPFYPVEIVDSLPFY